MVKKRDDTKELSNLLTNLKESGISIRTFGENSSNLKAAINPFWEPNNDLSCKYVISSVDNELVVNWLGKNEPPYLVENFAQYDWVTIFGLKNRNTEEKFAVHILRNPKDAYSFLNYINFYQEW